MTKIELDISDEAKLPDACQQLLVFSKAVKVFVFSGEMGSGKTTVIKELCKILGSKDNLSSPTYSIVNEYSFYKGKIFHFDLYRVNSIEELFDIGFEEYLDSGHFCFIEWPLLAESLLEKPYVTVIINRNQNNRYICAEIIS